MPVLYLDSLQNLTKSGNTVTITVSAFDTIFVKTKGVASYAYSGVISGTRTLPSTITIPNADPPMDPISITRHGIQHDMFTLPAVQSAGDLTLIFTGTNVEILQVMVMRESLSLDTLDAKSDSLVDDDSLLITNMFGAMRRLLVSGVDRFRWQSDYTILFPYSSELYDPFIQWMQDNKSFIFAQRKSKPWRVYDAVFSTTQARLPYISEALSGGNRLTFQIKEDRAIGDLPYPRVTSFNTHEENSIYFNDAVHLGTNGAVDDNDYSTYSTDSTYTINMHSTPLTHIWLKCKNVTSYVVQKLVNGTWTTHETITPTFQSQDGWDHSLDKLTTSLTEASIRLVFTGTGIQINEVRCLEHAGGLIYTNINPSISDRTAILHNSSLNEVERNRIIGGQRQKNSLSLSAVFGHINDFDEETFSDWIQSNPNFFYVSDLSKLWRSYDACISSNSITFTPISTAEQVGTKVDWVQSER